MLVMIKRQYTKQVMPIAIAHEPLLSQPQPAPAPPS